MSARRPRFLKAMRESDRVLIAVLIVIGLAACVGFAAALYPFVAWLLGALG